MSDYAIWFDLDASCREVLDDALKDYSAIIGNYISCLEDRDRLAANRLGVLLSQLNRFIDDFKGAVKDSGKISGDSLDKFAERLFDMEYIIAKYLIKSDIYRLIAFYLFEIACDGKSKIIK